MWVGVEHAIVDNHLQVRPLERLGQLRPVDTARVEAVDVVDLRAGDVLHRQDAPGGVRLLDFGDADAVVVPEVLPNFGEHPPLSLVVHLLADGLRELVGECLQRERPRVVDEIHQQRERPADDPQVGLDERLDTGPADLDGDLFTVDLRQIHLTERRAAYRLSLEFIEAVIDRPQFVLDDNPCLVPVRRWHAVLELGELLDVLRRQDVRSRREDLSEFDERRAER